MGAAFRSISAYENVGTNNPMQVPKPTGTADGDLLIALINYSKTMGVTAATGFTLLDTGPLQQGAFWNDNMDVYYKFASSEPGTSDWTSSGANLNAGLIACYTPIDASVPVSKPNAGYIDMGTSGASSSLAIGTETDNGVDELVIYAYGGKGSGAWVSSQPDAATTERGTVAWTPPANEDFLGIADEAYTTVGTFPSRTFGSTWAGNNFNGITVFRITGILNAAAAQRGGWGWLG